MVDFILNEEQQEYQKLAREFALRQMVPFAHPADLAAQLPADLLKNAWESGLLNVQVGESFGGLSLGCWDAAVISEELASGCAGLASVFETNLLASLPVLHSLSKAQQELFLKPLIDEPALAGCMLDLFAPEPRHFLKADRDGDHYELSGDLPMVANATGAAWYLVLANIDQAFTKESLTVFIVPKPTPGLTLAEKPYLLGRRAADVRRLHFDKVKVGKENIVGTEGGAAAALSIARPAAFVLLAAATVGIARCALEHSVRYAKERHTMGQPIASHQAVAFMLADMAKDIQSARLLTWQAAAMIDRGLLAEKPAAIARSFSQNAAMRVTTDAVQIFGGYGYSKEYPVEKLMRDAKMYQLFDGTSAQLHAQIGAQLTSAFS